MNRDAIPGGRSRPRGGLFAWKLKLLLDYIEAHLGDKITARDLASRIDVSVGQLFKTFKASVGVSPLRYVATRRVELVCTMLITAREPICQLALVCGFSDQAHLCRVFRRTMGISPSAWRRAMTADPRILTPAPNIETDDPGRGGRSEACANDGVSSS